MSFKMWEREQQATATLREQLARAIEAAITEDWRGNRPDYRAQSLRIADAVLTELKSSGNVVLKADRWNRVRTALKCECEFCGEWCDVLPGDLDPRTEVE